MHRSNDDSCPSSDRMILPETSSDQKLRWLCIIVILFFLIQILTYDYGRDQAIYAMVASIIQKGKMPYRDAWDFKPPGIFVIYYVARSIFGSNPIGIRILEVLGLIATTFSICRLSTRWFGNATPGFLASALNAMVHAQLDFWHTAQPESFGGMITILAYDLFFSFQKYRWIRLLCVGSLLGFTGLLKPPLAGAILPLALFTWLSQKSIRQTIISLVILSIGAIMPILLTMGWFVFKNAWHDLVDVLFVFTPHYTKLSWQGSSILGMGYYAFTEWLTKYSSLHFAGLLLLVAFRLANNEKPIVIVLGATIFIHLTGIAMQGKFFPYHYGATWPLTSILSAMGIWKLWNWTAEFRYKRFLSIAALLLISFFRSATKDTPDYYIERTLKRIALLFHFPIETKWDHLASVADVNAASNREVATWIREHTHSNDSIYVWGFEPILYDLSERNPASKFIYNVPQRVAWAESTKTELMQDLYKNKPTMLVVEHHDVFPAVTGNVIDSADSLQSFPELFNFIEDNYIIEKTIEDFDIYSNISL